MLSGGFALNKIVARFLTILNLSRCIQCVVAIFYGMKLPSELGSDFSIYYVGSQSVRPNFGLYSGFFDHKGPVYYAFLHFFNFLPFSIVSASFLLSLTLFLWFVALNYFGKSLNLKPDEIAIINMLGAASVIGLNSNSSIGFFLISIQVLTLAISLKGRAEILSTTRLIFISLGVTLALLTRLDGVFIIVPIVFILFNVSRYRAFLILPITGALTLVVLYISSLILKFGIYDFIFQAVLFNLGPYRPESVGTFYINTPNLMLLLSSTAIFPVVWVLVLGIHTKSQRDRLYPLVIIASGIAVWYLNGSSKDYHVLVLYPYILVSFGLALTTTKIEKQLLKVMLVTSVIPVFIYCTQTIQVSRCVLHNLQTCSKFESLEALSRNALVSSGKVEFLLNDGWIYVYLNQKPTTVFTAWYPMRFDLGKSSSSLRKFVSGGETFVIPRSVHNQNSKWKTYDYILSHSKLLKTFDLNGEVLELRRGGT